MLGKTSQTQGEDLVGGRKAVNVSAVSVRIGRLLTSADQILWSRKPKVKPNMLPPANRVLLGRALPRYTPMRI